ncbi:MAG: hypothetical protein WBP38_10680 [Hyphomicrobium sp.]
MWLEQPQIAYLDTRQTQIHHQQAEIIMSFFDVLGIVGVVAVLAAFYSLQTKRAAFDDYSYLLLNTVGAFLIVLSLIQDFNLSAFLMEMAWVLISLYGLYQRWRRPPPKVQSS